MRIAVNTGEALVTLDARATEGEGMAAGDVVNTTARLQSAAPVNGILVGESTYRATRARDRVRGARAGRGQGQRGADRGLGGAAGARELRRRRPAGGAHGARRPRAGARRRPRRARTASREERSPQLVTLVGVPGIGKSRLLYELSQIVDAEPDLISWRQGRSLPYGEGVSFWALAEMVKAQAGILETDDAAAAEAKLAQAVSDVVAGGRRRLGAPAPRARSSASARSSLGGDQRGEAFAAWRASSRRSRSSGRSCSCSRICTGPTTACSTSSTTSSTGPPSVPILVVGTARPELLERRPGVGRRQGERDDALALAALERRHGAADRLAARPAAARGRRAGRPARARRRQPALRRAVRADARRARRRRGAAAARVGAGDHRRAARRALPGGEAAAAGRGRDRQGLLARRGARARQRRDRRAAARARAQAVRPPRAPLRDGRRDGVRLPARARSATSRTARSRGRAGSRSTPRPREWIEALGRPEDHAEMLAHHYAERARARPRRPAGRRRDRAARREPPSRTPATAR